jgi:hypothetical protein
MTEEKKERPKTNEEIEKTIDETIDELDLTFKKSGRKIASIFLEDLFNRIEDIWDNNKVIVKHKLKSGIRKISKRKTEEKNAKEQ